MNLVQQPQRDRPAMRARRISVSALVDIHELGGYLLTLVSTRRPGAGAWLAAIAGGPVNAGVGHLHAAADGTMILGIGPGRWLVRSTRDPAGAALPSGIALFDVSDAWRIFRLGSIAARRLLAGGCPLDLDPSHFAPPACAPTRFDECRVLLCCTAPETYELYVERSVAEDLRARLVLRAAAMAGPAELEP